MLQLTSGNVGLTENVEGEPHQFMVWVGTSMTSALVLHTFEVRERGWKNITRVGREGMSVL